MSCVESMASYVVLVLTELVLVYYTTHVTRPHLCYASYAW
jgi:hypothetical protein